MSRDTVTLPSRGTCSVIGRVQAGFLQRITIHDPQLGQTHGPWVGRSDPKHGEIGRVGVNTNFGGGGGYKLEVHIESSADNGATWGENRSKYFIYNGSAPEPWIFSVLGSEDIGSSDNDWNDAYVVFSFPFSLFFQDEATGEEISFDPFSEENAMQPLNRQRTSY